MLGKLLSDLNLDRVYIANCIAIGILQSKSLLFSSKSPAFKTILQVLQELLVSFIQGGGGSWDFRPSPRGGYRKFHFCCWGGPRHFQPPI